MNESQHAIVHGHGSRFFSWQAAAGYVVANIIASLVLTAVYAAHAGFVDIAVLKQIVASPCAKLGEK